jgi:Cdc6-like AAA superfamily ATPase
MEVSISDNHNIYDLTHYFKNGQIAWKAEHNIKTHSNRKASRENVKDIYNEDGDIITLDEFDKLYNNKQIKTNIIYDLFLNGHHNNFGYRNYEVAWSSFMKIFTFIKY